MYECTPQCTEKRHVLSRYGAGEKNKNIKKQKKVTLLLTCAM